MERRNTLTRRSTWLTGFVLAGLALALAPSAQAQSFDICGCEGSPDSLGDFVSGDPETWPEGTQYSSGSSFIGLPPTEDGVHVFDNVTISNLPSGRQAYLYFQRNGKNSPATLLVSGNLVIGSGDQINVDGGPGTSGNGSVAGLGGNGSPGGFAGGDAAFPASNLETDGGAGVGPGGGLGSVGYAAGGGGVFVGTPELRPLLGGSGGGGGGATAGCSSGAGGGGGGGGAVLIAVNGTVTVTGSIEADGGNGGSTSNGNCATGGAGGSGGAIRILANQVVGNGGIFARGGAAGYLSNGGSPGVIRMEVISNSYGTNTDPVALRLAAPGPLANPITPMVAITAIDGAATPAEPIGYLGDMDMIVSAPGSIQMDLETSAVPSGTDVEVTVKPKLGDPPIVERVTLEAANCSAGVCTAAVNVDLDPGAYIVEARATFETP